jgi:transposase
MATAAETVDAVIGTGTRRDSHEAVIADPAGTPVMTMRIGNDSAGFTRLLAAIAEVVPGPRVAVCIEGSRSYGIGLARALAAAGLLVLECEQPSRKQRRGKGKSRSGRCAPGGAGRAAPGRGPAAGAARRR